MVHAGVLPQWDAAQTLALAAEVEAALRGPDWAGFLRGMYGNTPDRWGEQLEGADRLRVIVNALTRLRFCTPDGVMEFKTKDSVGAAPEGFMPWFDVPGRRTADVAVGGGRINNGSNPQDPRSITLQLQQAAQVHGSYKSSDLLLVDGGGNDAADLAGAAVGFLVFQRAGMFFAQAYRFGEPALVQWRGCSHKVFHCTGQGRSITHTPGAILAGMNTSLPLSLIAAYAENRVIGIDNSMPWHLPGDFKYFKATTLGKPIIMGRKTWDSLGRPLPGRLNIVVSRQSDLQLEGAEVYPSLEAAVARAQEWALEQGVDELMLIGGAQLYTQGLAHADRLYLTRVALSPEGDAWFPEFDLSQWTLVSNVPNPAEGDKPAYSFEIWEKA